MSLLTKKNVMLMFAGAVVFGFLAGQSGVIGQIGSLPSKVTGSISSATA